MERNDIDTLMEKFKAASAAWARKVQLERDAEAAASEFSTGLQSCMEFIRSVYVNGDDTITGVSVEPLLGRGSITGFLVLLTRSGETETVEIQLVKTISEGRKKIVAY